jgi:RND superfamily putative drug exporter
MAARRSDVVAVGPVTRLDAQTAVADVLPREGAGEQLVTALRALAVDEVAVGGRDARLVDERDGLRQYGAVAVVVGVLATLVLVFLLTGSVLLAAKTVVMNVLTVLAALGVVQLVFGEVIAPVLVFVAALSFGLSTDYGVFVLSRMKEAHSAGLPNREAVAVGLERSGRLVTAAALLLVVALGALGAVPVRTIEQTAVGLVAAVAVDAFVVRSLLVPSLMGLLGKWNWWAPAPLARLHAGLGLSESPRPAGPQLAMPVQEGRQRVTSG